MIITKDEWLAMRRKWLANCDAWLAQHDPLTRTLNPCDAPDITPKEFLLAVIRDCAIPFDLRIWAAKQFVECFPEHNLSHADYKVACEMMEWLTMTSDTSKMN